MQCEIDRISEELDILSKLKEIYSRDSSDSIDENRTIILESEPSIYKKRKRRDSVGEHIVSILKREDGKSALELVAESGFEYKQVQNALHVLKRSNLTMNENMKWYYMGD